MEKQYSVLYDFAAQEPTEMSCQVGEIVFSHHNVSSNGWLLGKIIRNQRTVEGLVPFSYLTEKIIMRSTPPSPLRPPVATQPEPSSVVKHIAVEHQECPICYDEMYLRPVSFLKNGSKRSCRHYLHSTCGLTVLRSGQKNCPICRADFDQVVPVPEFDTNPKGWFDCVDVDGSKNLSKMEVIEILQALLPIDIKALEKEIDSLWNHWDKNGSGEIDFNELCDKNNGLLVYIRNRFKKGIRPPPPKLEMKTRNEFFIYWDEDGNGTLNQEEIVRAIIKTFKLSESLSKINEIREIIRNVWSIFDTDNSGEIDLQEFVSRDGLGETLCASLPGI